MSIMLEAFQKAKLITADQAAEVERTKALDEELQRSEISNRERRKLRNLLLQLIKRAKTQAPDTALYDLQKLSEQFPDIFDEEVVKFSHGLNLRGIHYPTGGSREQRGNRRRP